MTKLAAVCLLTVFAAGSAYAALPIPPGAAVVPATNVGTASTTQTATLTMNNSGTTSATLGTAIQVLTQGVAGLDYAYVTGGTCAAGTAYTVNTTCTVQFTFTPAAPGVRLGAIELFTASGTAPIAVTYLSGTGNGPLVGFAPGTITTVAGNGTAGYTGDNGPATSAELNYPQGVTVDAAGNLYIADYDGNRVRKVAAATGIITTVAGNGSLTLSGDNGPATSAGIGNPYGVAVDGAGNLYIADSNNNRIRKVTVATGIITTVAGGGTSPGTCVGSTNSVGDGCLATGASLNSDYGVAVDGAGNLYIADSFNVRIRKVTAATGIITTVAGNGVFGTTGDNGAATSAEFFQPASVTVDGAGNLYIPDAYNYRVRKVTAGTGIITTVAGTGTSGYVAMQDGGPATSAELNRPELVAMDSAGNLYIADTGNSRIRKVEAATGIITTVAGNGGLGFSGDNGAATGAKLNIPTSVALDGAGNLYIVDIGSVRIRKVTAAANPIAYATATNDGTTDTTDGAYTLTVANIGNAALTLPAPGSGMNPGISTGFTPGNSSTCPQLSTVSSPGTLAAGASCTELISFAPVSGVSVSGSLVFTDNNLNVAASTQSVTMSGTGIVVAVASTTTVVQTVPTTLGSAGTGVAVTLTATAVSGSTSKTAVPTGSVQFYNGAAALGSAVTLNSSGVATLTLPTGFPSVQTASITATYAGDTNYNASTSTAYPIVVVAPSYTASASPSTLTVTRGTMASVTLSFTPVGNYSGTASYSCSGLPAFASCLFLPTSVTFTGNNAVQTTTLQLYTLAPQASSASTRSGLLWIPAMLLGMLLMVRRRKLAVATRGLLMLLVMACAASAVSGCGSGSNYVTPTGTDSVVVNVAATAAAGSSSSNLNQNLSISITIQ